MPGQGRRLCSIVHIELVEDGADVITHRAFGQGKLLGVSLAPVVSLSNWALSASSCTDTALNVCARVSFLMPLMYHTLFYV